MSPSLGERPNEADYRELTKLIERAMEGMELPKQGELQYVWSGTYWIVTLKFKDFELTVTSMNAS